MKRWIWIVLLATACDGEPDKKGDRNTTPTGTTGEVTGSGTLSTPTPTGVTTTAGTTTTTGGTTTGTTSTTTAPTVRFVALGDAGTGSADQYAVSDAVETVCAQRGCEFALYLGDNFYDTGVDGPDDNLFIEYFEAPYANLTMPFYVALGNHDYGAGGAGLEFWKGDWYVQYATNYTTKFTYPDIFYGFQYAHVRFLALNTTELFFGITQRQSSWIQNELNNLDPSVDYVIAFGHHPYISNGRHGNAGRYEGIPGVPFVSGVPIKNFFDNHVCGNVTAYFSGHDHNRQLPEPTCGTEFIVAGAGAKTTDLEGRGNLAFWEDDTIEGFAWVEIQGNQFTIAFYNKNATLDYEQVFTL